MQKKRVLNLFGLSNPKEFIGSETVSSLIVEKMKLGNQIRLEEKSQSQY